MRKRTFSLLLLMILVILAVPTTIWAALPTNEELASNDMRIAKGLGELRSNDMRIINGLGKFRENDMRIIKGLGQVTDRDNGGASDTTARLVIYRMVAAEIARAIEWQAKPVFSEKNLWADIKAAPAPVSEKYLRKHVNAKELACRYAEAAMIYPKQLATSWLEKASKVVDDGIKAHIRREIAREVAKNATDEDAVVERVVAIVLERVQLRIAAAQAAAQASAKSAMSAQESVTAALGLVPSPDEYAKLATKAGVREAKQSAIAHAKRIVDELETRVNTEANKTTECLEEKIEAVDERVTVLEKEQARRIFLKRANSALADKDWDQAKGWLYLYYGESGLRARGWDKGTINKGAKHAEKNIIELTSEEERQLTKAGIKY